MNFNTPFLILVLALLFMLSSVLRQNDYNRVKQSVCGSGKVSFMYEGKVKMCDGVGK